MSKILDDLLSKASIASQHINAYTGTDYSGIETLRRGITTQEQKVRDYHLAVDEAKANHQEADAKQKSAQREIVGLLERKSSWSPADLERYMSLVRSEHLNEQDVQAAKDNMKDAERNLEDARALLEKLERKQYHEEQIWSDTIRRNSTWVTFGLMGVNIVLLLAQILIFEPYRRKKIVRDVKSALDEKTLSPAPATATAAVEEQIDAVAQPQVIPVERIEAESKQPLNVIAPTEETVGKAPLPAGEVLPPEAAEFADATPAKKEGSEPSLATPKGPANTWEAYQEAFRDLFSERMVQLRKVDVTNTALQGAATGVAVMGLLFVLVRPK
ncbi:mitochondrial distribution and morphology family 33, fungi [Lecanosticta acicola]|uniref:Sensitive to high expression protein 9, mitochondrial n=1 Tax=Lecanosticta acicola TaxID=111012 RepID=A0AAI9EBU9_9PEZI|nr:mitochondrial distribution and morphology family 33, fungi [Lecanosticta acicola]